MIRTETDDIGTGKYKIRVEREVAVTPGDRNITGGVITTMAPPIQKEAKLAQVFFLKLPLLVQSEGFLQMGLQHHQ